MRPCPPSLVSLPLLLAGTVLAGCSGKNQRVETPVEQLLHERYNEVEFPEDDELIEDLPEAGDTGWTEELDLE